MIVWHTTMSLDGFIAGPDDAMEWVFEYPEPDSPLDEVIARIGALLVGRNTFDVGDKENQVEGAKEPYEGAWSGPQFVLTHRPPAEERADVTFLAGDIRDAVARAEAAVPGKDVVVLGADVARQSLEAGLVEEILIHLAPILLGDGVRLYGGPGMPPVKLEKIGLLETGQVTQLRFRVVG